MGDKAEGIGIVCRYCRKDHVNCLSCVVGKVCGKSLCVVTKSCGGLIYCVLVRSFGVCKLISAEEPRGSEVEMIFAGVAKLSAAKLCVVPGLAVNAPDVFFDTAFNNCPTRENKIGAVDSGRMEIKGIYSADRVTAALGIACRCAASAVYHIEMSCIGERRGFIA